MRGKLQAVAAVLILLVVASLELRASGGDSPSAALQHLDKSRAYTSEGNNLDALAELFQALTFAEADGDSVTLAIVYNNMGNIYTHYRDFGRSTPLLEEAYAIGRHHLRRDQLFQVVQNMVGNNLYEGNLPEARRWFDVLKHTRPDSPQSRTLYSYCMRLLRGMILDAEGCHAEAVPVLQEAETFALRNGMDAYFQCGAVEELHKAYRSAGMRDSAQAALQRFYSISAQLGLIYKQIDALRQFTADSDSAGRPDEALRYKALRLNLEDSLMNLREYNRLAALQTQLDSNQKKQRIASQQSRIALQTRWLVGGSVALFVLAALLGYIVVQKRRVQQAYAHLFDLNRQLVVKAEQEKAGATGRGKPEKYGGNSLANEQRIALVRDISQVMKNPENFCAPDFSLQKLSEMVGSNTKYVSQIINQEFEMNFNAYVNAHRINEARLRLADHGAYGNQTIQAISESLGFGSVSTFNAAFKKLTGMSPSLYHRMARETGASAESREISPNS